MKFDSLKSFDFRDICITEFDHVYRKYDSCNTPLSHLPSLSTSGVYSGAYELFWRSGSVETLQECVLTDDRLAWHLPHPELPALRYYAWHPEGDKHSLLALPNSELTWHMLRKTPSMAMVMSLKSMMELLSDSELDWLLLRARGIKRRDLDGANLFNIANALHRIMLGHLAGDGQSCAAEFDYCMGQVVLDWMELLSTADGMPTKPSNRERILTRAIDYIRQNYPVEIKIRDLVDYTHTTSRNLQLVFKSQFGLTPLQFLRCYRLVKFHRALRDQDSVTDAAVICGLRHMGRLPDHYRALFCEKPGDYLNRLRGQNTIADGGCQCGICASGNG